MPLLSKVIAVADAYNAMTSNRPYRDAMPTRVARMRLAQAVETQFDTSVVAAFEAILAVADEGYRTAQREDFRPGQPSDVDELDSLPMVGSPESADSPHSVPALSVIESRACRRRDVRGP